MVFSRIGADSMSVKRYHNGLRSCLNNSKVKFESLANGFYLPRFNLKHFTSIELKPEEVTPGSILTVLKLVPYVYYDETKKYENSSLEHFCTSITNISRFIVPSSDIKIQLVNYLNVDHKKICIIPLGVEQCFFESYREDNSKMDSSNIKLLYVGSLEARKNFTFLVRFAKWMAYKDEFIFKITVAGNFIQENISTSISEIYREGVSEYFEFVENSSDEDLVKLYSEADLFIYPSIYEGFPLAPLEAMLMRTPTMVSNRVPANREVLGDSADYFDPDFICDAYNTLKKLIKHPLIYQKRQVKGRDHALKYTWDKAYKKTIEVYENLV